MLRKGLAALIFTAIISAALWSWAATYFQVQTKLSSSGGWLQVRDNAIQTASGSLVYSNFSTSAPVPVRVAANTGYAISSLTRNGIVVPIGNYTSHYSTSFQKSGGTQALIAGFAAKRVLVTGKAIGPGTVTPTSASVVYGSSVVFTATPQNTSTFVTGTTGGVATTLSGEPVPYPYAGQVKIGLSSVTTPQAVTATFTTVGANAGVNQIAMILGNVTLNGSIIGGGTPLWSQDSGPAVALTGAGTLNPTFTPTVTGIYKFKLTQYLSGAPVASATTQVEVVQSLTASMRTTCNGCHSAAGLSPSLAFTSWSSSGHKALSVSCVSCHTNAAMPTPVNTNSVDGSTFVITGATAGPLGGSYCAQCHSQAIVTGYNGSLHKANGLTCTSCHTQGSHNPDPSATVCQGCHYDTSQHPVEIGANACIACHNPHSAYAALPGVLETLHYNNMTSGAYPASYVTSRAGCTDCHFNTVTNLAIRQAWYTSGHAKSTSASWAGNDYKTMSGCVQCHSTTGFVAYSTGKVTAAWGMASDKTKELLTCKGCHANVSTGILRTVAPVRPYANESYTNPEVGKSNLCMSCHSGTNSGASITAKLQANADFTDLAFTAPHYNAAGGTMYARGGFHFAGRSYQQDSTHGSLGAATATGACVSCHKSGAFGHTFRVGVLPLCADCHGADLPAEQLAADRVTFANALEVLRAQLAASGFVYTEAAPHFNERNWGAGQTGANTQGAAYNYVLLLREPGAFAHNAQYAKQLVFDSIDYLDNGQIDDSVASLAVPMLRDSGAISQEVADSVTGYKAKNLCITCHGGTAATTRPMSSNAHSAHLSSVYGPGSYLGSDLASCQSCHVGSSATHSNGLPDLLNGPGSLCQGCHAGSAPGWTTTARLDCTVCHAATPAVLPNGVAAPYKGQFASTGHGRYAVSNQCTVCHDPDASHIAGSLGSHTRLRGPNDNNLCGFCHNDAAVVGLAFRNMSTHITEEGRSLDCRECHDPHGSSNLAMIRGQIDGSSIVFTDKVNAFIDPITNMGLCQVCHRKTNHYRAGEQETGHFTSDCLSCHPHNSPGGAFKPIGGTCDSCHGYPPAPKNTATVFGEVNKWINARFEEYSGGGGAHLALAHVSPLAKASDGWTHCTVCHNGGTDGSYPFHRMSTPVQAHIDNVTVKVDPKLRFSEGFTIYTGAQLVNPPAINVTGSCFNISCHMSASPRWSTER